MNPPVPPTGFTPARSGIHRPATLALAAVLTLVGGTLITAHAARISEPDTVLYGRIIDHVGDHHFLVTQGELSWNLRTTGPNPREVRLRTQLQSLGEGRYSYQLRLPHDALAYDLELRPNAVGLAAAGARVEHLAITWNGRALTLTPSAIEGFAVSPATRGAAQRIDLELSTASTDSDGDGAPDWWEDQNGLDRFDPTDAPTKLSGGSTSSAGSPGGVNSATIHSFAEWRAAWFPSATGDLDAFSTQDSDHDGVSNLLEYAFDLDPTRAETDASHAMPRNARSPGGAGVTYWARPGATDLDYQVEVSRDLVQWASGPGAVEETGATERIAFAKSDGGPESASLCFYRVRVSRKP